MSICSTSTKPFVCLFLGTLMAILAGCGSRIETPTEFTEWSSKDGTFMIDYPKGWEAKGGGKAHMQWARFESGGASIRIGVSLSDSLMGDIATSSENMLGGVFGNDGFEDNSAPEAIHEISKDKVLEGKGYSNFKEGDGKEINTHLGRAWRTEFTARKNFTRSVRGYRVTILALDYSVNIFVDCNVRDWKTMQPVFNEMLEGMRRGVRS